MCWFSFSAGNPLPEVFCSFICLFHAASHWRPIVILQLDNISRPFSSFVISYWWSPNLQQRFCLLLPRYMPWHSVLLSFFPFLLHQPSRSPSISHVMFQPFLLQMSSNFMSSAGFMAQLLEMKGVRVKFQTQRRVNVSKWTALLLFSLLSSAGGFCLAGFLPPRQIITSMHLVACSSVLWCDTAKGVKYRKASVVPDEELSARVTCIYIRCCWCWRDIH